MEGEFTIQDLRVQCTIGCLESERETPQELLITVQYGVDILTAVQEDNIDKTIDYSQISDSCLQLAQEQEFELIETYAYELIHALYHEFSLNWIRVEVKKPRALPLASYTSVKLELDE